MDYGLGQLKVLSKNKNNLKSVLRWFIIDLVGKCFYKIYKLVWIVNLYKCEKEILLF